MEKELIGLAISFCWIALFFTILGTYDFEVMIRKILLIVLIICPLIVYYQDLKNSEVN